MLHKELDIIRAYFISQPISKAWVFGSVARGDDTPTSDIDILVKFDEGVGLFKFASIKSELENKLNRSVDLVPDGSLLNWVIQSVERDKILIYERKA